MTLEEEIKELEARLTQIKNKLEDERVNHHTLLRYAQENADRWKDKYDTLYTTSRIIGGQIAVICHLEKEVQVRDAIIADYQKHYQKFGHFYTDFENNARERMKNVV